VRSGKREALGRVVPTRMKLATNEYGGDIDAQEFGSPEKDDRRAREYPHGDHNGFAEMMALLVLSRW
jgi:hypothetical protein